MMWPLLVLGFAAAQAGELRAKPETLICGAAGDHSFVVADARAQVTADKLSIYIFESPDCLTNAAVSSQQCRGLVLMEIPFAMVRNGDGGTGDGGLIDASLASFVVRGADLWSGRCERRLAEVGATGSVSIGAVTLEGFEVGWSVVLPNAETSYGQVSVRWAAAAP